MLRIFFIGYSIAVTAVIVGLLGWLVQIPGTGDPDRFERVMFMAVIASSTVALFAYWFGVWLILRSHRSRKQ